MAEETNGGSGPAPGAAGNGPAALAPAAVPTVAWLLTEGQRQPTIPALLEAFAAHLCGRGVPLERATLHVRLLHPQIRGMTYLWRADRPGVEALQRAHGIESTPEFMGSPVFSIMEEGAEGVRYPLATLSPPFPFPLLDELRAEGMTDYAAMPMVFSNGRRHAATFASRAAGGFGTEALTLLYDSLPALTALVEARVLRLLATNLLNTYVGQEAGSRILNGDIRRGSGLTMQAVLWYCDLRGFTTLSDRLALDRIIALLNGYFEIMGGAVQERGGEIVKFIGDAMLAVFAIPAGSGPEQVAAACAIALDAARDAQAGMERLNAQRAAWGQPRLGAGIALHHGDVMFGNIGAPDRLDFTVIGPAVNLVTRLEGLTRGLGRGLVTSADFARACPDAGLASLGLHPVRGLDRPVELFGLDPAP